MSLPRLSALVVALLGALALAPAAGAAPARHWLCRPGLANNPCMPSLSTTQISPIGSILRTSTPKRDAKPAFDCFYVYPTVSDQKTPQANFRVDPEQRSIALYQASRYSQHCRVFAPMYRQITLAGLLTPDKVTAAMRARTYQDVVDAWRSYLKHDNKGRGVVLIGHSQGSFVLRQLIRNEVDAKPAVRRRLISAVLLGGNVLVKKGSDRGGDFKNVPACRKATQLGCVIAFSTFNATPPNNALFGTAAGRGVTTQSAAGQEVLCTNPAALGGGPAKIDALVPSAPFARSSSLGKIVPTVGFAQVKVPTAWIEAAGAYTARCSSANNANVLLISSNGAAPVLMPSPTAAWGLHLVDANIALGNLVDVVAKQGATYVKR